MGWDSVFIAWSSLYKEACVVSFEICPKRNIGNILDKNIDNLTLSKEYRYPFRSMIFFSFLVLNRFSFARFWSQLKFVEIFSEK